MSFPGHINGLIKAIDEDDTDLIPILADALEDIGDERAEQVARYAKSPDEFLDELSTILFKQWIGIYNKYEYVECPPEKIRTPVILDEDQKEINLIQIMEDSTGTWWEHKKGRWTTHKEDRLIVRTHPPVEILLYMCGLMSQAFSNQK